MSNLKKCFSVEERGWIRLEDRLPRETIHRIASTVCVKGVKLLSRRMIGGIPSAGQITPEEKEQPRRDEEEG